MSRVYKATGINLKGIPLGENDRLLTIFTLEYGIIQAVAPGARKYQSSLRGRSGLFVVNNLLIVKGKNLDKVTQAETIISHRGLSKDLSRLAASQYLAEMILYLLQKEHPEPEVYRVFLEHLLRIEQVPLKTSISPYLSQALFHLLAVLGIAPIVHQCCATQKPLIASSSSGYFGFSIASGGVINLPPPEVSPTLDSKLGEVELTLLQKLPEHSLMPPLTEGLEIPWTRIEHMLREYVQYHCGRSLRSGGLVDWCSELEF